MNLACSHAAAMRIKVAEARTCQEEHDEMDLRMLRVRPVDDGSDTRKNCDLEEPNCFK